MNAELGGAGVYNKLDQKNVTAWLDLRNKAAHGQYDQYTADQVTTVISGVQEFAARHRPHNQALHLPGSFAPAGERRVNFMIRTSQTWLLFSPALKGVLRLTALVSQISHQVLKVKLNFLF